jgi:hypothetical protein
VSLVQVLVDGSKDPGMRQLAGIMMKNALYAHVSLVAHSGPFVMVV